MIIIFVALVVVGGENNATHTHTHTHTIAIYTCARVLRCLLSSMLFSCPQKEKLAEKKTKTKKKEKKKNNSSTKTHTEQ